MLSIFSCRTRKLYYSSIPAVNDLFLLEAPGLQRKRSTIDIERRLRNKKLQFYSTYDNENKEHLMYVHRERIPESNQNLQGSYDGAENKRDPKLAALKYMKVSDVLSVKKLLRQQIEISQNSSVDEAISRMVNNRVASFMVVDDMKKVTGMFTARDILRVMAQYSNKLEAMKSKVKDFMIPLSQLVTSSPTDSIYQCLLVMTEMRIRNLPVVALGEINGIINVNDICDFLFSSEQLGGKKAYINNISDRKGLREGISIQLPDIDMITQSHLYAVIGSAALPHPFKYAGNVGANANEHRHMDFCNDVSLSEDAHFELSLQWPTSHSEKVHYVGVADGVGSWRGVGVDPKVFSNRLIFWAKQFLLSYAPPAQGNISSESIQPPSPHQVLKAAWEMVLAEKVVGSSTMCVATLDHKLNQLNFSNVGDNGVVILRHIDSDIAGYMREKKTPRHLRSGDLRIAFISQQQLRSFNLPYQLGYTNVPAGGSFETPNDAVNASIPVLPGDIIIVATDGLYDNVELEDICDIAEKWEVKWFGGPMKGLNKESTEAVADLALQLVNHARQLSVDSTRDSPFALLAKENDIMWGGGMPDDCTVVCMRVGTKKQNLKSQINSPVLASMTGQTLL